MHRNDRGLDSMCVDNLYLYTHTFTCCVCKYMNQKPRALNPKQCLRVHTHLHVHIYMCVCKYMYVYVCVFVCVCVCVCVCI
jgi:hypothetical protein